MSAADKLREARKLIERGWCQGEYARDAAGSDTNEWDDTAVSWCARGAINRAASTNYLLVRACEVALHQAIGEEKISVWNDAPSRTQAEVLAAFDRAIALAEQQP